MGTLPEHPKTAPDLGKRPLARGAAQECVPFSVLHLGTAFLLVNQAKWTDVPNVPGFSNFHMCARVRACAHVYMSPHLGTLGTSDPDLLIYQGKQRTLFSNLSRKKGTSLRELTWQKARLTRENTENRDVPFLDRKKGTQGPLLPLCALLGELRSRSGHSVGRFRAGSDPRAVRVAGGSTETGRQRGCRPPHPI